VPGARYLPSVKLGRWNGKISYFSLSGSTYINLLSEIIPVLDKAGYHIELEDLRTYSTKFEFNKLSVNSFEHIMWPKGHPIEGQPIMLRDYQIEIINNFLANPQALQAVPTGSGKTIMTAALSYSIQDYGRSIVIVPNKSLVVQTEIDYKNLGLDVGVYFGDRKDWGNKHVICTWQSVLSLIKSSRDSDTDRTIDNFLKDVVCVICDEVHSVKADQLKSMLTGVMAHIPIRWGVTGTIPKEDFASTSLRICIGELTNTLLASDLQEKGVLAQCHVNVVQLQDGVEYSDYQSELKYLLEDKKRIDTISDLINKIKETGNTLVLVDRVMAGNEIVSRLPGAVFVSGGTKLSERKEEYDEIATSDDKILVCTYGVAAVGINVPRLFNIVLIEPGKSFVRVIQSIGRGLRKAPDKEFVQIWDITSNAKFAKRHLTQRKLFYTESGYPFKIEKLKYK